MGDKDMVRGKEDKNMSVILFRLTDPVDCFRGTTFAMPRVACGAVRLRWGTFPPH